MSELTPYLGLDTENSQRLGRAEAGDFAIAILTKTASSGNETFRFRYYYSRRLLRFRLRWQESEKRIIDALSGSVAFGSDDVGMVEMGLISYNDETSLNRISRYAGEHTLQKCARVCADLTVEDGELTAELVNWYDEKLEGTPFLETCNLTDRRMLNYVSHAAIIKAELLLVDYFEMFKDKLVTFRIDNGGELSKNPAADPIISVLNIRDCGTYSDRKSFYGSLFIPKEH